MPAAAVIMRPLPKIRDGFDSREKQVNDAVLFTHVFFLGRKEGQEKSLSFREQQQYLAVV